MRAKGLIKTPPKPKKARQPVFIKTTLPATTANTRSHTQTHCVEIHRQDGNKFSIQSCHEHALSMLLKQFLAGS